MHESTVELYLLRLNFQTPLETFSRQRRYFEPRASQRPTNQSSSGVTEELAQYFLSEQLSWSRKEGAFLADCYCRVRFFSNFFQLIFWGTFKGNKVSTSAPGFLSRFNDFTR